MMVLENVISSPHRRMQTAFSSTSFRKQHTKADELGSFSAVIQRHRFLLMAVALLAFLCTIYLYLAITLGAGADSCSRLLGTQKAACLASIAKGKLKFF